ncbi:antibiotic biosynthesis monooxygenase [Sphingomonas aliaeris]|uniref:Antibiotic biosynthesis monooxygenase n=2 Tax=Sphingomonas aliaeris TaxID=2759526 RepID=A0A974NY96_9SPHN|nr:antibiotic biosynthesis monooxygenase [Sphingomonas aliaeris]
MAISSMILSLSATEAIAANASPMVRIAEIEVDPDQLAAYKAILAEEQEASVRLEPGVLMLHSVAIAAQPNQIRLLEVYADRAAYEAHIRSSHFVKYKTSTERMVRSLKLIETTPILLCAKAAADSKSLVPTCR